MITSLCVGMCMHANAQSYTERIQQKQQGKGNITIHQSKEIDDLVNDPTATGVQSGNSQKPHADNNQKPQANNKEQKPQTGGQQSSSAQSQQSTAENQEPAAEPTQPTATRKVTGYRVQAFAGGNSRKDRQTAEQISNSIKSQIPGVAVYVHFYSPRWICRVGNFRTYEEAHQMMVRLQNMGYKQATVVKGKITVAY